MSTESRPNSIEAKIKQKIDDFSKISDWESRYQKIIDLGKNLPDMPEALKVEEAKIKGCQSQVWLHAELKDGNRIHFIGDSDSVLVKGILALLIEVYSNSTIEEVLATPPQFIKDIGLESHLSPSRANGLMAMVKQMKNFAIVFSYMKTST